MFQSAIIRAKASSSKPSGRLLERVTLQKAAQGRLALDLGRERRLCRIAKAQRDNIADALVRAPGVVMFLNPGQRPAQVELAQQNQMVQRLTDCPTLVLGVRVAEGRVRGC